MNHFSLKRAVIHQSLSKYVTFTCAYFTFHSIFSAKGGGQILVFLVGNTKRARGPNLEGSYVNSKSIPYMDSVFRWCFDIIYMNDFADVLRFIYYRSGNYF